MNKEFRIVTGYGIGLLTLGSLLFAWPASAVGVAVSPAEISIRAVVGEEATVRIKVSNPSSDVAVFEVYPDDFAAAIKAIPSSFTLESGSEKYVTLAVKAAQEGRLSTLLSVVGRPLASNAFQAGSGVKVPLAITVASATGFASVFATLGTNSWLSAIALVLLASWLVYRYWSRRQRSAAPLA